MCSQQILNKTTNTGLRFLERSISPRSVSKKQSSNSIDRHRLYIFCLDTHQRSFQQITIDRVSLKTKVVMVLKQTIIVLGAFRPSMNLLTLFNCEHFHGNRDEVIRRISQAIGLSALLLVSLFGIFCNVWFCVNNEFNFELVAQAMSTLLSSGLLFLMYVAFLMENRRICSVVDCLNGLIRRSEWSSFRLILFIRVFESLFNISMAFDNFCEFSTVFDNFWPFSTISDSFRQFPTSFWLFSTVSDNFRRFSTIFDNIRQISTIFDNIRQYSTKLSISSHFQPPFTNLRCFPTSSMLSSTYHSPNIFHEFLRRIFSSFDPLPMRRKSSYDHHSSTNQGRLYHYNAIIFAVFALSDFVWTHSLSGIKCLAHSSRLHVTMLKNHQIIIEKYAWQFQLSRLINCSSSAPPFDDIPNESIRFYCNWFIQLCTSLTGFIAIVASLSFYVGVTAYIEAMVADLRQSVEKSLNVAEIRFHNDILE